MPTIYVVGPVIRDAGTEPQWVNQVYSQIRAAVGARVELQVPEAEAQLESAVPPVFLAEILKRIRNAEAVISVYAPESASGPVEMAFAGMLHKPQLVLAQDTAKVPRLIAGLAEVTVKDTGSVHEAVRQFLDLVAPRAMALV